MLELEVDVACTLMLYNGPFLKWRWGGSRRQRSLFRRGLIGTCILASDAHLRRPKVAAFSESPRQGTPGNARLLPRACLSQSSLYPGFLLSTTISSLRPAKSDSDMSMHPSLPSSSSNPRLPMPDLKRKNSTQSDDETELLNVYDGPRENWAQSGDDRSQPPTTAGPAFSSSAAGKRRRAEAKSDSKPKSCCECRRLKLKYVALVLHLSPLHPADAMLTLLHAGSTPTSPCQMRPHLPLLVVQEARPGRHLPPRRTQEREESRGGAPTARSRARGGPSESHVRAELSTFDFGRRAGRPSASTARHRPELL